MGRLSNHDHGRNVVLQQPLYPPRVQDYMVAAERCAPSPLIVWPGDCPQDQWRSRIACELVAMLDADLLVVIDGR